VPRQIADPELALKYSRGGASTPSGEPSLPSRASSQTALLPSEGAGGGGGGDGGGGGGDESPVPSGGGGGGGGGGSWMSPPPMSRAKVFRSRNRSAGMMPGRSTSFAHDRTTSDEMGHSSDAATFLLGDGSGDVSPGAAGGAAARASEPRMRLTKSQSAFESRQEPLPGYTMSEQSEGEGEVSAGAVTMPPPPLPPPVLLAVMTEVGPGRY